MVIQASIWEDILKDKILYWKIDYLQKIRIIVAYLSGCGRGESQDVLNIDLKGKGILPITGIMESERKPLE